LDNTIPDPVEEKTISNPIQIQKIPKIRPNCTSKSRSCTPEVCMDWILDYLDPDSGLVRQDPDSGFLNKNRIRA